MNFSQNLHQLRKAFNRDQNGLTDQPCAAKQIKVLFLVPPKGPKETQYLLSKIPESMGKYVSHSAFVSSWEEYQKLDFVDFDAIFVQMAITCADKVLTHQCTYNKALKWVHSLHVGVDGYCTIPAFKDHAVPLTNGKGVFGPILGEFLALGVLFHTKRVRKFLKSQAEHKWEPRVVELVEG